MRKTSLLIFLLVNIVFFACNNVETKQKEETQIEKSIKKIELIDFYGKRRCTTCENIEANTKYTIENFFKEELENGIIELKFIDVEKDENYYITEKFQATGTSLFLNVINNGKEKQIDLTSFAFKWAGEQVEFSMELEKLIKEELKNLK